MHCPYPECPGGVVVFREICEYIKHIQYYHRLEKQILCLNSKRLCWMEFSQREFRSFVKHLKECLRPDFPAVPSRPAGGTTGADIGISTSETTGTNDLPEENGEEHVRITPGQGSINETRHQRPPRDISVGTRSPKKRKHNPELESCVENLSECNNSAETANAQLDAVWNTPGASSSEHNLLSELVIKTRAHTSIPMSVGVELVAEVSRLLEQQSDILRGTVLKGLGIRDGKKAKAYFREVLLKQEDQMKAQTKELKSDHLQKKFYKSMGLHLDILHWHPEREKFARRAGPDRKKPPFGPLGPMAMDMANYLTIRGVEKNAFIYISLIQTLTILGKQKDFWDVLIKNRDEMRREAREHPERISSLYCGEYFKKTQIFQADDVLTLILYSDEVDPADSIGGHSGKHKSNMVYYTIGEIPDALSSRLTSIFYLGSHKKIESKKITDEKLWKPIIEEFNILRNQGIEIMTSTGPKRMRFVLAQAIGDNLDMNAKVGMTKCFGATYHCRFCTMDFQAAKFCSVEDKQLVEERYTTFKRYSDEVAVEDRKKMPKDVQDHKGLTHKSALWGIHDTHPLDLAQAPDIFHDFPEGAGIIIAKFVLRELMVIHANLETKKKGKGKGERRSSDREDNSLNLDREFHSNLELDYEYFSSRVKGHTWDKGMKPKPWTWTQINSRKRSSAAHMTGREMYAFILELPLLIGCRVQENNEVWELLLRFQEILLMSCSPRLTVNLVRELKEKVQTHHLLYLSLLRRSKHNSSPKGEESATDSSESSEDEAGTSIPPWAEGKDTASTKSSAKRKPRCVRTLKGKITKPGKAVVRTRKGKITKPGKAGTRGVLGITSGEGLTPKMHFMTHYPEKIRAVGPLINFKGIRMEAKHKRFKAHVRGTGNFKNVPVSFAESVTNEFVLNMTNGTYEASRGMKAVELKEYHKSFVGNVAQLANKRGSSKELGLFGTQACFLMQSQLPEDSIISEYKKVKIHGTKFEQGQFLLYKRSAKENNGDIFEFGEIQMCFVVNGDENNPFFLCTLNDAIFQKHYNAYEFTASGGKSTTADMDKFKLLTQSDLLDEKPYRTTKIDSFSSRMMIPRIRFLFHDQ
jgi:hypothetical protein